MKSRIIFLSILSIPVAFAASAQEVETDDMYFRSKDRAVLTASQTLNMKTAVRESEVISPINPTDSYSARNVNPEYLSQTKLNPSSGNQEPVAYFIPGYLPTGVNQSIYNALPVNNFNNNPAYSNFYGGGYLPYYRMNSMMGYGMGMSTFGNPYYNNMYSPMGYYDPFGYNMNSYNGYYGYGGGYGFGSGLSLSMGMGFGGWNNWGNSFYNGGYGWNSGYYGGNNIIIINGDGNGRNVAYGKRSSRSNDLNNNVTTNNRSTSVGNSQGNRTSSSGRVANTGNDNAAGSYYQRGWRTNPETNTTRTVWSNSGRTGTDSNNNAFNSTNNNRSNSNTSFGSDNSRSSSWGGNNNVSSGGGSRSSSVSTGGGSSSSGARGGRD